MPEGAHPLGWTGMSFVPLDGQNWPVSFAAKLLDIPERELRKQIKDEGIEPAGVIRMSGFRRSGRQPMAYPAAELIRIAEGITALQANGEGEETFRSA